MGEEVKEPWSFTVVKLSAIGAGAFSEGSGADTVEMANFKVLRNRQFQPYVCSSEWNRNRQWGVCRQLKEEEEVFAGN